MEGRRESVFEMTVYIDVLIIINVYITYFTLRGCALLLHMKSDMKRLAAASVLGGLTSAAALLPLAAPASLCLKALLTALIVYAAFGRSSLKAFALRYFICVFAGMLLCGTAVLLRDVSGGFVFAANGYVYMDISALTLVISTSLIYGILSLIRRVLDRPAADEKIILGISNAGRTVKLTACADSGNYLRDHVTGRAVVLCRYGALQGIEPQSVRSFIAGDTDSVSGIRLIPMRTAAGGGLVAAFMPDKLTAEYRGETKDIDALIGVSKAALSDSGFDALINPKILI